MENEGRVRMGRNAMSVMVDEERVGGWMMRLSSRREDRVDGVSFLVYRKRE